MGILAKGGGGEARIEMPPFLGPRLSCSAFESPFENGNTYRRHGSLLMRLPTAALSNVWFPFMTSKDLSSNPFTFKGLNCLE